MTSANYTALLVMLIVATTLIIAIIVGSANGLPAPNYGGTTSAGGSVCESCGKITVF